MSATFLVIICHCWRTAHFFPVLLLQQPQKGASNWFNPLSLVSGYIENLNENISLIAKHMAPLTSFFLFYYSNISYGMRGKVASLEVQGFLERGKDWEISALGVVKKKCVGWKEEERTRDIMWFHAILFHALLSSDDWTNWPAWFQQGYPFS